MAEKRVSVRLSATGGRQVKGALRGVGEAGQQGFRRLSREMEAANRRLARFARQATRIARVVGAAAAAAGAALIRSGLQTISNSTVWRFCDRHGLTAKKSPGTPPSRTATMSGRRAKPGSRHSPSSTPRG